MPVIELVVTVCLALQPDVCSERRFAFSEGSVFGCMVRAQPFLADWADENRRWTVKAWRCGGFATRERGA